jgi:hypothetical protein
VHIVSDLFYDFIMYPSDPSTPAAGPQNEVVMDAFLAAARAYDRGGYQVYLDGVIGPWWMPALKRNLITFEYVLLHVSLEVALERTRLRSEQGLQVAQPRVVEVMHDQFAREQHFASHRLPTDNLEAAEVEARFLARRQSPGFIVKPLDYG